MGSLEHLGAPQEVIDAIKAQSVSQEVEAFEVWPENENAVRVFLDLATVWTWVPVGMSSPVRTGISSMEIESTIRMNGISGKKKIKEVFQAVRLMESAVLEEWEK